MSRPHRLGDDSVHGTMLGNNDDGRNASSSVSVIDGETEGNVVVSSGEGQANSASSASSSSSVTLNLKTLTGQVMSINLPSFEGQTILQLKQAFEAAHGIPAPLQRWIWAGREVNDFMSATECRLENGCTVHLLLRQNQPAAVASAATGLASSSSSVPAFPPPYVNHSFPGAVIDAAAIESMGGHGNISADRMVELQRGYQLARAVRIFAVFDAIFLILWSLSSPPLAIGVLLCLFGYYGATNARFPYVALYLVFLFFAVALRVYYLVESKAAVVMVILYILAIIIEFYIIRLTIQYMKILKSLNEEERAELLYMIRPYSRPTPPMVQYV